MSERKMRDLHVGLAMDEEGKLYEKGKDGCYWVMDKESAKDWYRKEEARVRGSHEKKLKILPEGLAMDENAVLYKNIDGVYSAMDKTEAKMRVEAWYRKESSIMRLYTGKHLTKEQWLAKRAPQLLRYIWDLASKTPKELEVFVKKINNQRAMAGNKPKRHGGGAKQSEFHID